MSHKEEFHSIGTFQPRYPISNWRCPDAPPCLTVMTVTTLVDQVNQPNPCQWTTRWPGGLTSDGIGGQEPGYDMVSPNVQSPGQHVDGERTCGRNSPPK